MIPYEKSFLNLSLIFRINGSPIWRAAIPGIISTVFYIILETFFITYDDNGEEYKVLNHPYGVGVLISAVSFLIIFRANYGYQRYWEACGACHHFMSKWLDAVTHCGCYHLQQSHHNHFKPPSYYDNHDLNIYRLSRDREQEQDGTTLRNRKKKKERSRHKSINALGGTSDGYVHKMDEEDIHVNPTMSGSVAEDPRYLMSEGRKDGGWGLMFGDDTSTFYSPTHPNTWEQGKDRGFASEIGGRTHNLFLQELCHLASLCTAVAFSTLRNDIEGTESPLDFYVPGSDWPEVDPDKLSSTKKTFGETLRYLSGRDRTAARRTKHNAARPLPVLGGVSDNEILFLQRARGASAKVNLAWHWLSEFIIREHLAGSLGKVGPPIVSRIFQFLSDGMIHYNHARKIMFIPFPFPHAQISAFFVFTIMFTVPLLMDEYSNNLYLGAALTFLTVTCLAGLHEVGRELENPFRNVPNEIPVVTLQALFNEALIVLYSGYHPDQYWNGDDYRKSDLGDTTEDETSSDKEKAPQDTKPLTMPQLQSEVVKQKKEIERLNQLINKGR